jgi:hypothetical protein
MPYASDAQRRFFHTATARKKGISAATVNEFDQASKGMKLPDRAKATHSNRHAAMRGLHAATGRK